MPLATISNGDASSDVRAAINAAIAQVDVNTAIAAPFDTFTPASFATAAQGILAASALQANSALGTPASGVLTNCTGTAAGLTAGNVTTNANLTGHITSVGNAAVLGSFTLAQLSAAVSDANIARIDAAQTFAGVQTFANGSAAAPTLNFPLGGGIFADATGVHVAAASTLLMRFDYNAIVACGSKPLGFSSGTSFNSYDASLSRNAVGVLQVGTTGANASGSLLLTNLTASGTLAVTGASTLTGVLTMSAVPRFNGTNTTGAGMALLGSNSPAATLTAPYTWVQITTSDGSTAYVPAWK